eukprot:UN06092
MIWTVSEYPANSALMTYKVQNLLSITHKLDDSIINTSNLLENQDPDNVICKDCPLYITFDSNDSSPTVLYKSSGVDIKYYDLKIDVQMEQEDGTTKDFDR